MRKEINLHPSILILFYSHLHPFISCSKLSLTCSFLTLSILSISPPAIHRQHHLFQINENFLTKVNIYLNKLEIFPWSSTISFILALSLSLPHALSIPHHTMEDKTELRFCFQLGGCRWGYANGGGKIIPFPQLFIFFQPLPGEFGCVFVFVFKLR